MCSTMESLGCGAVDVLPNMNFNALHSLHAEFSLESRGHTYGHSFSSGVRVRIVMVCDVELVMEPTRQGKAGRSTYVKGEQRGGSLEMSSRSLTE